MIRMTMVAALGAAAFVSLGASGASADTILNSSPAYVCSAGTCTQSFDTGSQTLDWSPGTAGPPTVPSNLQIFNLNLFDPTLGTLTGVIFSATFSSTITSGSLTNSSSNAQSFTFKQDTALAMSTGGVNTALDTALSNLSIDPKYSVAISNLAVNAKYTLPTPIVEAGSGALTGPTSAFIGTGTQQIDASTSTTDSFTGAGGNITTAITTLGDANLTVTYTYSPPSVPEPFTAALLGSGIVFLGMIRRRAR
jgi:hypothetical protein